MLVEEMLFCRMEAEKESSGRSNAPYLPGTEGIRCD